MITTSSPDRLALLLTALADDIDVPESKYADAQQHYKAVGQWLAGEGSSLANCSVSIFAQGSFALGTAITPPDDGDYDVDAVCLLKCPAAWSQEKLKEEVGARLRAHKTYREMLVPPEGRRRCWTLQYADGSKFHLDVLPAKPDNFGWLLELGVPPQYAEHAVQITCRDAYRARTWPKSNPGGYQRWFVDRMRVRFDEARVRIARARAADVKAIPEYAVRTPLQRVVQILKRQRDTMFGDDPDRPISILITTLAANAYRNESDVMSAYQNVVRGMRQQIGNANGRVVILNPVNPLENFADRWAADNKCERNFFEWLNAVEGTERELSSEPQFEKRSDLMVESFGPSGARAVSSVTASLGERAVGPAVAAAVSLSQGLGAILRSPHRLGPPWPDAKKRYKVTVTARASRAGFRPIPFSDRSPSPPLSQGMDIWYTLKTNVPEPFEVFWQVVNTGADAAAAQGLRGNFDLGLVTHRETARYRGRHSIQAFVVKDNQCVGRSRPVYVLIR